MVMEGSHTWHQDIKTNFNISWPKLHWNCPLGKWFWKAPAHENWTSKPILTFLDLSYTALKNLHIITNFDTRCSNHREPGSFSSRPNWDPSTPLNRRRVCPPYGSGGGGGRIRLRERGWGGEVPFRTRGQTLWYSRLCGLWFNGLFIFFINKWSLVAP